MRFRYSHICLSAIAVLLSFSFASADSTTLSFNVGVVRDQNMNPVVTGITTGALGVLVADTSGIANLGFSQGEALIGTTLSVNNTMGASNNVILATFHAKLLPSTGNPEMDTQFQETVFIDTSLYPQGTKLALYWFPSITASGTTLTTSLLSSLAISDLFYYGYYRTDVYDSASGSNLNIVYSVPSAGSWILGTWDSTSTPGSKTTKEQLSATKTILVPEPSSVVLLVAGAFLMTGAMLRRNEAA